MSQHAVKAEIYNKYYNAVGINYRSKTVGRLQCDRTHSCLL